MFTGEGDWDLKNFTRAHLSNDIEILLKTDNRQALVVWPWYADPDAVDHAVLVAGTMGFGAAVEVGNMVGYTIEEIDCNDWDYMMLEVEHGLPAA